jgi:exodeoxyribonuclease VIII
MRAAVNAHLDASELLANGEAELTWRAPYFDTTAQARTDWFGKGCSQSAGAPYIVDLKSCESLERFERDFWRLGYHRQAAFYCMVATDCGVKVQDFFFVAAEKDEPFGVGVFKLSAAALDAGAEETHADLAALTLAYKTGLWPAWQPGVATIELPAWWGGGREAA